MNIWDLMLAGSLAAAVPPPVPPQITMVLPAGVKQVDHVHGMYVIELTPRVDLSTMLVPKVDVELPRLYRSYKAI